MREIEQKLDVLTPKKVVELLDKYVIGQKNAKKAVAIALRNRTRRMRLDDEMREEIAPKNILMIGPTGVGKTELARRLAKLVNAPFIKVEATKYTEVGYVGRDVEAMIRDLVTNSFSMIKKEQEHNLATVAEENVKTRILEILLPGMKDKINHDESAKNVWEKMKKKLESGEMEDKEITLKVKSQDANGSPVFGVLSNMGMEDLEEQFQSVLGQMMPQKNKERKMTVKQAKKILKEEEIDRLIDFDKLKEEALQRVENLGIIFLDEIDKVAGKNQKSGPDVSREGVQRDLLPIVEGTLVNTRYGQVKTDHILFIAAGAFHVSKPSDLIPELQGRFPIRIELDALNTKELQRILVEPKNALVKQYQALLKTEDVELVISEDAILELAEFASEVNERMENIGARRLHTIMEKLLEEVSFEAPELKGQTVTIDASYVKSKLANMIEDQDLIRYVL